MKKIISTITILSLLISISFSQNEIDALRYSQNFLTGTARSVSMGGAFGALGGNFSAISLNPAGLGVYRTAEFAFTPTFSYNISTSKFNENSNEDFKYNVGLDNLNMVTAIKTNSNNGWKAVNIGFGYNKINNFNKNTVIKRDNSSSSILDDWVEDANNGLSNSFSIGIADDVDVIYFDTNDGYWHSDFEGSNYGQKQTRTINSSGSMGEYILAVGANYNDKVYLGGSFSYNAIRYNEKMTHKENEIPDDIDYLKSFTYRTTLNAKGSGANLKLGAIIKPLNWVRIGLSVASPTFYSMSENYSSYIDASLIFNTNPLITNINTPVKIEGNYDYHIVTPIKTNASLALVLMKSVILSFDYEYMDYSKTRLRSGGDDYDFANENDNIQNIYGATGNLKAGIEYRMGPISLRGGYAYYGSPYKTGSINENNDNSIFSGGLGINSNSFFFDLAYSHMTNSDTYVLYQYPTTIANVNNVNSKLLATIGFRF